MRLSNLYPVVLALTFTVSCGSNEDKSAGKTVAPVQKTAMQITFESTRDGNFEIYSMNDDGTNVVRLTRSEGWSRFPAWSPDGSVIVFSSNRKHRGGFELYTISPDSALNFPTVITETRNVNVRANWSPDGKQLVFHSSRGGPYEIWKMNADGSGAVNLTNSDKLEDEPAWSPDGRKIAFVVNTGENTSDIWVMDTDGSHWEQLTHGENQGNYSPSWSPDSSQIVYISGNYPDAQVYVMNADGAGKKPITSGGFTKSRPVWSPDGSRIAFSNYTGDVVNDRDIFLMNPDGTNVVNITNSPGLDDYPSWSPVRK
jgi:TolB protein